MEYLIKEKYIVKNPKILPNITNISQDLINKIIDDNPLNIQYIPKKYIEYDLIIRAMDKDVTIIQYIENQTDELHYIFMKKYNDLDRETIGILKNPSYDICKMAIDIDPYAIIYIDYDIPLELKMYAYKKDPNISELYTNLTIEEQDCIIETDFRYKLFYNDLSLEEIEEIAKNNKEWFFAKYKIYGYNNNVKIIACKLNPLYIWKIYPNLKLLEQIIDMSNSNIREYFLKYIECSNQYNIDIYDDWDDDNYDNYIIQKLKDLFWDTKNNYKKDHPNSQL